MSQCFKITKNCLIRIFSFLQHCERSKQSFQIYAFRNLFRPLKIFSNLFNCFISLSNLLYENSFKGLKIFSKVRKGFEKRKSQKFARFARNVVKMRLLASFSHTVLNASVFATMIRNEGFFVASPRLGFLLGSRIILKAKEQR